VTEWRRSSHCAAGDCITVTESALNSSLLYIGTETDGQPGRKQLTVTRAEFAAFVKGCADGEFDDLIGDSHERA